MSWEYRSVIFSLALPFHAVADGGSGPEREGTLMVKHQHVSGLLKPEEAGVHPYRSPGLDDIYLVNGVTMMPTPFGPKMVVEDEDSLRRAISDFLVLNKAKLSHQELRFVRHQMGMTQAALAAALGVTDQTVARCEKGESKVSGPIARLVRILYAFRSVPMRDRLAWLDRIYRTFEREASDNGGLFFKLTPKGWVQADEAID